jgi:methyl coenzyme M reductase system subunit A2
MDETFIVVSHDMDFVKDICDRLALMRGGKIIEIGKTEDVLSILTEEERKIMRKVDVKE